MREVPEVVLGVFEVGIGLLDLLGRCVSHVHGLLRVDIDAVIRSKVHWGRPNRTGEWGDPFGNQTTALTTALVWSSQRKVANP